MNKTYRNFVLTIFDFNELPNLQHDIIKYSAYGDEICPTTKKEHKQAFVIFKAPVRFRYVKNLFPTAHIERMRGSLLENEKYCSKEGSYHEYGKRPMSQEEKGLKGAQYWLEQRRL